MIRDWIESNFEGISTSLVGLISIALLGTLIGRALRYALNFIIGAGLNAEALGIFTFGLVLVRAGGILSSLGLRTASQRLIATSRAQGDEARLVGTTALSIAMPFGLGLVLALVLYLSWPATTSLLRIDMPPGIRLFLFGIPLFAVMDVGASATRGFKTTRYYVYIRELGQSGIAVLLVGLIVYSNLKFTAVILVYLFSLAFGALLSVFYLRRLTPQFRGRLTQLPFRYVLSVSVPLLLVAVSQYLVTWTDILILGTLGTATEVGHYQAAFLYSSLITIVLFGVNAIFPALAADLYESGDIEHLETVYTIVTKWSLYAIALFTLSLLLFSEDLLSLFGPDFVRAEPGLHILLLGQAFAAATGPVSYLLTMSEYETYESYNSMALGLLNLVLNLVLIPPFGIEGAAIATAVSLVLLNVIRLIQVNWLLGIQPYNQKYWKGGVALVAASGVMYLLSQVEIQTFDVVIIPMSGGIAFAIVMTLLGVDEEDLKLFSSVS